MSIKTVIDFFKPAAAIRQSDLVAFDVAKNRLHEKNKDLIKEADAFGDMIREMRGASAKKRTRQKTSKGAQ